MTTKRNVLLGAWTLAVAAAGGAYATFRGMGSPEEYEASTAITREALSRTPDIRAFVRFATLAPSGHNAQPWLFRAGVNHIAILPDRSRRTPVVDPDDHHLFVSLGCAAENLALASGARGRPGELQFDPSNEGSILERIGN